MKKIGIYAVAAVFTLSASAYGADQTLVSTKTSSPIVLDGMVDKAWSAAKAMTVTVDELPYEPSNGYKGMSSTAVSIKSLYDDKNVYFLISYKDPTKSLARFPWVKQKDGRITSYNVCYTKLLRYKKILNKADFILFVELRNMRKEIAEREGVPPYVIFTNEQLADIVRLRISTKAALLELKGVGTGRVDKYGEPFLARIGREEKLTQNEKDTDRA